VSACVCVGVLYAVTAVTGWQSVCSVSVVIVRRDVVMWCFSLVGLSLSRSLRGVVQRPAASVAAAS
jgi:hypothetical protein